jgi:23S rRNA pseudouridine1911/1915/1917 synthase
MKGFTRMPEKNVQFNHTQFVWNVQDEYHEMRLDRFVHLMMPTVSRTYIQKLIADGAIQINNRVGSKCSTAVKAQETIAVYLPPVYVPPVQAVVDAGKNIAIVAQEDDFYIINKPAGITVHRPHANSAEVTVVDWLLHNQLVGPGVGDKVRPGIVHRLDKNTSGLMIVARTPEAHAQFARLFHERSIKKTYIAIVQGHLPAEGTIDLFVGRDPFVKVRMQALPFAYDHTFRHALTHFKIVEYRKENSVVELHPVTGRTHQIRVHMAAIGHALVGDAVYGKSDSHITRHALHAHKLEFLFNGTKKAYQVAVPTDMLVLI